MNITRVIRILMTAVILVSAFSGVLLLRSAFASEPKVEDEELRLEGTIEKFVIYPDGTGKIVIDGTKILIKADTEIKGMLAVGAMAEVRAALHHGKLVALEIRVDEVQDFEGTIEKFVIYPDGTGKIIIDGTKILIKADTEIDGRLIVGAMAEVRAAVHDGKLLALKIVVADIAD
ncbi:MAG: DUF5666 domain-containing protein [Dehalococcoidales bacterium]